MLFANVFCFFVLFCVTHDSVCLFVFGFIFVPFILECLLLVFCCFCYLILIFLHLCVKKKKKRSCCMSLLYLTVWISCSIKMFFHTQFSCSLSSTDQNKYVFLCLVPVPNRPTTPLAPGALVPPPRPSSRPKLPAGKLTGINEIVMETYVLHTFIAVQIISIYSKRHLSESL